MHWNNNSGTGNNTGDISDLLDYIRTELLNGQGADVASKLANNTIAKTTVVEVQNILHNLREIGVNNMCAKLVDYLHNCRTDLARG
jgi:hypothetical protein